VIRFIIYMLLSFAVIIFSFKHYTNVGDSNRLIAGYATGIAMFAFAVGVFVPFVSFIGIILVVATVGWFAYDTYAKDRKNV
jgi:hypothetical protein